MALVDASQSQVQHVLEEVRCHVQVNRGPIVEGPTVGEQEATEVSEDLALNALSQPMVYLRSRCPLCFGGKFDGSWSVLFVLFLVTH